MKTALLLSLLALGAFWMAVYDAGPLVSIIVVVEAAAVVVLAFAYAWGSSR
ncbi:MAG: hypothetical protein ACRDLO_14150 [Solirubrobacterales bacterium]